MLRIFRPKKNYSGWHVVAADQPGFHTPLHDLGSRQPGDKQFGSDVKHNWCGNK